MPIVVLSLVCRYCTFTPSTFIPQAMLPILAIFIARSIPIFYFWSFQSFNTVKLISLKVHKHEIFLNFFWPKSNPYMPLVNFRKKIHLVSFDFGQNFKVRTFTQWLSIRGTKFLSRDIQKIFFLNLHYGPIRWVPRRFFQILIFYSRNLHFN